MRRFLTPAAKIWCICVLLLGFTLITGAVSVLQTNGMNSHLRSITAQSLPAIYSLGIAEGYGKDIRGKMRSYIVADKAAEKNQNEAQFKKLERQLTKEQLNYRRFLVNDQERELFVPIEPALQRMEAVWTNQILPLSQDPAH
jgi:CHASE3 domain sensor protein